MISEDIGVGYQDECFGFSLSYRRNFTQFRDLVPSSDILFRISFQTSDRPIPATTVFPQHLYSGEVL
jgi:LPS-assembly protein